MAQTTILTETEIKTERLAFRWIEEAREQSARTIIRFTQKLAEDPSYAFEGYGDEAMNAAAKSAVAERLASVLEHEKGGLEATINHAHDEMFSGARTPSRSTSPTTNLMQQLRMKEYADFLDRVAR